MTATSLRDFTSRYDDDERRIPEWTLGDRLTKSMRLAGLSASEMAEVFGVGRETISRWINDRGRPKPMYLMLWATGCGVDLEWLETGTPSAEAVALAAERAEKAQAANPEVDGLAAVHPLGLEPRTRCLTVAWQSCSKCGAYGFLCRCWPDVNQRLTANRRGPVLRVVAA